MSQEQFADLFHVTRQTVSNWENNRNYPDMFSLKQISDTFQVSFDMLLKDDLELDMIGLKGSPTNVYKSFTKEVKGAGTILNDLTPEQAVEAIVKKLEEKFII